MLFRKDLDDVITKYLKDEEIDYKYNNNIYSFELNFSSFSLNPYFMISDDILTFMVNIKMLGKRDNVLDLLNDFNLKSKFFTAKTKNNILYLEYNTYVNTHNIIDILDILIAELNSLNEDIDRMWG